MPGQVGVLGQQGPGGGLGLVEQAHVPLQAGQLQLGQAVLPGPEKVPGAPELQVRLGDLEAVGSVPEEL